MVQRLNISSGGPWESRVSGILVLFEWVRTCMWLGQQP